MIDLYRDRPDLYDLLHDEEAGDAAFYAGVAGTLAPPGGDVLELGCGSGRVLEVLLRQGMTVTGLDGEPAMLARGRRRLTRFGARARLVEGDMRAFDLGGARFDLVVVAANTFMHLEDHPAQLACLRAIRAHLRDDGAAILDLANPFHTLSLPQGVMTLRRQVAAQDGREVTVMGALEVDPTYPRAVDHLFFDETDSAGAARRLSTRVELRLVFMPELELLLTASEFGIADAYGDYDLGPYHAAAERMIVVARPLA